MNAHGLTSSQAKLRSLHEEDHKLLEAKLRVPKCRRYLLDGSGIVRGLLPAQGVPEELLPPAFLADRAGGEHLTQFLRRGKIGIGNTGYTAGRFQRQLHRFRFLSAPLPRSLRDELQQLLLSPFSDRVELLQADADRVDEAVT